VNFTEQDAILNDLQWP